MYHIRIQHCIQWKNDTSWICFIQRSIFWHVRIPQSLLLYAVCTRLVVKNTEKGGIVFALFFLVVRDLKPVERCWVVLLSNSVAGQLAKVDHVYGGTEVACSEKKCIHKTKLLDTKASNLSLILISLGYCSFILQQVRYESVISPTNGWVLMI
jgi:hypothetical protein